MWQMIVYKIALSGMCRRMILRPCRVGMDAMNSAGTMAKYLATSLAILNVVSVPRVISNCLPISTISKCIGHHRQHLGHSRHRHKAVVHGVHGSVEITVVAIPQNAAAVVPNLVSFPSIASDPVSTPICTIFGLPCSSVAIVGMVSSKSRESSRRRSSTTAFFF